MSDNHKIVQAEVVEIEKTDGSQKLHPLIVALAERKISPEEMSKIMDLQERHEKSEAQKSYNAAMVQLKRELPAFIEQDKTVDYQPRNKPRVHYTHASLSNAVDQTIPHLTQFGFSHSWKVSNSEKLVYVTCRITHENGHSEECTLSSVPDFSGGKSESQAIASTITRLNRYTYMALLGLASKDMEENDPREPAGDVIDQDKNLEAIGILKREEIKLKDAEKHLQKDFKDWTRADLTELGKYIRAHREQRETDAQHDLDAQ